MRNFKVLSYLKLCHILKTLKKTAMATKCIHISTSPNVETSSFNTHSFTNITHIKETSPFPISNPSTSPKIRIHGETSPPYLVQWVLVCSSWSTESKTNLDLRNGALVKELWKLEACQWSLGEGKRKEREEVKGMLHTREGRGERKEKAWWSWCARCHLAIGPCVKGCVMRLGLQGVV